MKLKIHFSHKEELWNSWSHAGGILLGVIVGIIFLYWCFTQHNGWATAGIILYLFGMLMSYIASTTYHAISAWSKWKERLRKWDHAAIYWHIAGSYSPITLIAMREQGYWGWSLFIFIWACAIAGTVMSFAKLKDHSLFSLPSSLLSILFPQPQSGGLSPKASATSRVLYSTASTRKNTCIPYSTSLCWQEVSATSSPFGTSS